MTWLRYRWTTARYGCSPRAMTSSRRRPRALTGGALRGSRGISPTCPGMRRRCGLPSSTSDGIPGTPVRITGGSGCAAFQPAWSPDGALWCVVDPDGWWNLHRWHDGKLRCMYRADGEFGKPLWQLGTTTFGFDASGSVVCTWRNGGAWHLGRLDPNGAMTEIPLPWTSIDSLAVDGSTAAFIGGAPGPKRRGGERRPRIRRDPRAPHLERALDR